MTRTLIDQFTRQALAYSRAPAVTDSAALDLLLQAVAPKPPDTLLDVACGPGLVALAFAPQVAHVAGIDLTPAMLQRAQALQAQRNISNAAWHTGDVSCLPFPDASFSIVLTRYAIHHFPDPARVIAEMFRVCRAGGTVAVIDMFTPEDPAQADAFNQLEKLRDPSHARALRLSELCALLQSPGGANLQSRFHPIDLELDSWLARSFTSPENAASIRQTLENDLAHNRAGMTPRRRGREIHVSLPVAILVAQKP